MASKEELQFAKDCGETFEYFCRYGLKVKLDPENSEDEAQQLEFVRAVDDAVAGKGSRYISVRSGHGTGKTGCLSWLILWGGLTKRDCKIPTTAPVASQLKNQLIPEVKKWSEKMYPKFRPIVEVQSVDVKFQNGNHCFARTARKDNTEALAGVHAEFVIYIIDEASGVDHKVFEVIEGALTGDNFLFIMTSNPTRTAGFFYDSQNKNRAQFKCLHFDSLKSPNVNKAYSKRMADKYGIESDIYRVRVKGDFPLSNTSGLYTLTQIEEAQKRDIKTLDTSGAKVWGLDCARFGNDKSSLCKRHGYQITEIKKKENADTMVVANWVAFEYNQTEEEDKPDAIFVDTIGLGAGVFDRLLEMNYPVLEGNSSFAADDSTYLNKRT